MVKFRKLFRVRSSCQKFVKICSERCVRKFFGLPDIIFKSGKACCKKFFQKVEKEERFTKNSFTRQISEKSVTGCGWQVGSGLERREQVAHSLCVITCRPSAKSALPHPHLSRHQPIHARVGVRRHCKKFLIEISKH